MHTYNLATASDVVPPATLAATHVQGSDTPKDLICEAVVERCRTELGSKLQAVVLTGSLARDESTFLRNDSAWLVVGDAEFVLVIEPQARKAITWTIASLCTAIEHDLAARGITCSISLSVSFPRRLRKMRPSIFTYELRERGQVIWGKRDVLSLIEAFPASDIPREDAWRLLCNRMIEVLERSDEIADRPARLSPELQYRIVKLYLDMATSFLVFNGAYESTYRGRADRLRDLASRSENNAVPFPLPAFSKAIDAYTQLKVVGSTTEATSVSGMAEIGFESWQEAVSLCRSLWRWELLSLTAAPAQISDRDLMLLWMRQQPYRRRWRGWLHVLRQSGWHRSWPQWWHWVTLALRASPRYWIYQLASELLFEFPSVLRTGQSGDTDISWTRACAHLPTRQTIDIDRPLPNWQWLAAAVGRNYKEFVVSTPA